jgi:uncharacterized phiE125 gp8 family phage protein
VNVERLSLPTALPFSLDAVLAHVRLTADDAAEAQRIAQAAAKEIEDFAQIALLFQTIKVTTSWSAQPGYGMRLPIAPLLNSGTVSITVDGVAFTDFDVETGNRPSIWYGYSGIPGDDQVAVIMYQAGFGADAAAIPADLAHAILDQAAVLFDARGAAQAGTRLSPSSARIAARYRRVAL